MFSGEHGASRSPPGQRTFGQQSQAQEQQERRKSGGLTDYFADAVAGEASPFSVEDKARNGGKQDVRRSGLEAGLRRSYTHSEPAYEPRVSVIGLAPEEAIMTRRLGLPEGNSARTIRCSGLETDLQTGRRHHPSLTPGIGRYRKRQRPPNFDLRTAL
jgi:hypothetical protein